MTEHNERDAVHGTISGTVPVGLDLATAIDLVVQDYRGEVGPEVPAVAAVVDTREGLTDWDLGYMASDRPDIPAEVVVAMGVVRDANAADLAAVLGVPADQCGEVFHGAADTDEDEDGQYEETLPERDPEPGSWIARNLPAPTAREVPDGFEPDIPDRDEDGRAADSAVPDADTAMHSLTARYLHEGDRFAWRGEVHTADDAAIEHDGIVTVPLALSDGSNGWVELPAEAMVPLHHDDLSEPHAADVEHSENRPAPPRDATDAALDRIDAVLAELDLPPWEEQVERCAQSVRAAAKAVHRVEDADRAERLAAWNTEDADTAADTAALEYEGGLR